MVREVLHAVALAAVVLVLSVATLAAADRPSVVFVSRVLDEQPPEVARTRAVTRATRGSLLLLRPGGEIVTLVDAVATESNVLDVLDPDVSADGERVVFSGYSANEESWRIFEVAVDGTRLRQITRADAQGDLSRFGDAARLLRGHDDLDPCYLPDGRICFVSTRYPGVAPDERLRTTNLYVVNADGTDLHRITTERFGADTPAVDPESGRIVYSRWWRSLQASSLGNAPVEPGDVIDADGDGIPDGDGERPVPPGSPGYGDVTPRTSEVLGSVPETAFPGVNSWFLAGIDPDGTDLSMFTGFGLDRVATQAYRPSFLANGDVAALFIPRTPFIGRPRGNGLRLYSRDLSPPETLGGPQTFGALDPEVPDNLPRPEPSSRLFGSVAGLLDGRLLVTAAESETPLDYDVYLMDADSRDLTPVFRSPASAELDAVPVLSRPAPPVIADATLVRLAETVPLDVEEAYRLGSFVFETPNIHFNAPVDFPVANAPPVGEKLAIEFYMAPQGTSDAAADVPVLIQREIIPPDGSIRVELPAGVPLFEVLRRQDGHLPVGRDGQVFHVGGMNFGEAGETSRCVGCHAGHSMMEVPEDASWTNLAPSARVTVSSSRGANDADILDPAGGLTFSGSSLVDRRTTTRSSIWAADGGDRAPTAELSWSVPIRARQVIVHAARESEDGAGGASQTIRGYVASAFLGNMLVERVAFHAEVSPEGTPLPLDPAREIDRLSVTIDPADVEGLFDGESGVALAEIEVIARTENLASPFDPCGGIVTWNLLGPFANPGGPDPSPDAMRRDFLANGGPGERDFEWFPGAPSDAPLPVAGRAPSGRVIGHTSGSSRIDLEGIFGGDNVMAYAQAYVTTDRARRVYLAVTSDDSIQVLLNGEEVWIHSIARGAPDACAPQDVTPSPILLREGTNSLIAKVFEGGGAWSFSLRFQDERQNPMTEGIDVALFPPAPPVEPGVLFERGDSDGDGRTNITDAIVTLRHLFGGAVTPGCLRSADTDDSGRVELADAVGLLHHLFLGGPAPAHPFGGCGADTTRDELSCHFYSACE